MALRRSVEDSIFAGSWLNSTSRLHSCVTISKLCWLISVKEKRVLANSGTAKRSRRSRRVKPMEPAPIMAILSDFSADMRATPIGKFPTNRAAIMQDWQFHCNLRTGWRLQQAFAAFGAIKRRAEKLARRVAI